MCRRNNLVHHRVTSVGQKVPLNVVEIAEQFLEDMKNISEFANLANMDETPCYFDIPRSSTIDKKGVQTVKVKTTGAERLRFTVALTAGVKKTENGFTPFRLSPLLIFKNLLKAPPGKYPAGMAVLGSKGGTMKCNQNPFLTVVLGDFNTKSSNWYKHDQTTYEGSKIDAVTSQFGLQQLIKEPTHILGNLRPVLI